MNHHFIRFIRVIRGSIVFRCEEGDDFFEARIAAGYVSKEYEKERGFQFFSQLILISFAKTLKSASPVTSSARRSFASAAANASA